MTFQDRSQLSPGRYLRQHYLPGRTVRSLANAMGVPLATVRALLNDTIPVDPPLAMKLAAALGTSPELWLEPTDLTPASDGPSLPVAPREPWTLGQRIRVIANIGVGSLFVLYYLLDSTLPGTFGRHSGCIGIEIGLVTMVIIGPIALLQGFGAFLAFMLSISNPATVRPRRELYGFIGLALTLASSCVFYYFVLSTNVDPHDGASRLCI